MPAVATLSSMYGSSWNAQSDTMPQQMQTMSHQHMQQMHMQQMQMAHIMNNSDFDAEVMQGALELLGLRNHFSAMSMSAASSSSGDLKKSKKASFSVSMMCQPSSASRSSPAPSSAFMSAFSASGPSMSASPTSPSSAPTTKVAAVMKTSLRGTRNLNKKRKRASRDEVAVLRRAFHANPLPPQEVRVRISQQLGWTPRKVKIWFQNERAKLRKRARDSNGVEDKEEDESIGMIIDSDESSSSSHEEDNASSARV